MLLKKIACFFNFHTWGEIGTGTGTANREYRDCIIKNCGSWQMREGGGDWKWGYKNKHYGFFAVVFLALSVLFFYLSFSI